MIKEVIDTSKVEYLYKDWTETCVKSCLQGTMGKVFAPDEDTPDCAVCVLGDYAFYAGKPSCELVMYKPSCKEDSDHIIMVADSPEWDALFVKCYEENCMKKIRYAIKKETDFNSDKLLEIKNALARRYTIKFIDEELYDYCKNNSWCYDFVGNYDSYELFERYGLGAVIMDGDVLVAGASSYSHYNEGIEVEVITREDYRKQGLASIAAATLILECINRNLYPSWDAANLMSVGLSKKLGYEFDREYTSYRVNW